MSSYLNWGESQVLQVYVHVEHLVGRICTNCLPALLSWSSDTPHNFQELYGPCKAYDVVQSCCGLLHSVEVNLGHQDHAEAPACACILEKQPHA
jgi:hypothetical protein